MKLYYSPGACSLSPHIVALEAGLAVELDKVDLQKKITADGRDYSKINPKGYVPALQLDSGEVLTENPAIVQYLADQKPMSGLAPSAGSFERYRLQEMLGYINSEIHKTYSPLFSPATSAAAREEKIAYLYKRYAPIEQRLSTHPFLVGDHFTGADAYLFTVTAWADRLKVDLSRFPGVIAFQKRVAARPAVQKALREEGLLH
jgi:glutathione S-transferase